MKYLRYSINGKKYYGILNDDNTVEKLKGTPFDNYEKSGEILKLDEIKIETPCDFTKAVCIGLNYRDHAQEFGLAIPEEPIVFIKPSTTAIAENEEVIKPSISKRLDYEAELAIIIKKDTHKIKVSQVDDYVLGYTCANDITARDLQPKQGQWTIAKSFDTFCPFGPYIATDIDPTNLKISSVLNGKVMQESNTSNLIFSIKFLVSYLSQVMTLKKGDIILTGTPGGISGMEKGDEIKVIIENVGTLTNKIR